MNEISISMANVRRYQLISVTNFLHNIGYWIEAVRQNFDDIDFEKCEMEDWLDHNLATVFDNISDLEELGFQFEAIFYDDLVHL